MTIWAVVPVKGLDTIKSRLSLLLDPPSRREVGLLMLTDVVRAVKGARRVGGVMVVSPDAQVLDRARALGVGVLEEESEGGVNVAIARALSSLRGDASAVLILPSDIPLITGEEVDRMVEMADGYSMVIAPSLRKDGTNALLLRPPDLIPTRYDEDSFRNHLEEASRRGVRVGVYSSQRLMLDLDSPPDIERFMRVGRGTLTHEFLRRTLTIYGDLDREGLKGEDGV